MGDPGAKVAAAVENAAKDVTAAVDHAMKDVSAAVGEAVREGIAAVETAGTALEGEVQNLMRSVSDNLKFGEEEGLKSSVVAFLRRIPKKAWFLMGLGMAGIVFVHGGGNLGNTGIGQIIAKGNIRQIIAKGRRRFSRNRHHSICHYLKIQPAAFNVDDPLTKRKFCAQDIFDVESKITGFGSLEWQKTHDYATKTAAVLETLKQCGATCIGKTVMDDLGFSLIGTNRWLGTPKNPLSTFRICGGASSGAAVSVGSKVVDFALGIDTVGDVRVPAACCGVLGFRSSHGAISLEGTIPVASSCDAVGWFARDAGVLRLVGRQLCPHLVMDSRGPRRFYMAHDIFKLSSVSQLRTADVLARAVRRTIGRHTLHDHNLLEYFEHISSIQTFRKELGRMGAEASQFTALDVLRECMLLNQRHEFKSNHGEWIAKTKPRMTEAVDARVEKAVFSPNSEALRFIAVQVREETRTVVNNLLKNDAILVVPALPSVPPKISATSDELEIFEHRTHTLMSLATLSGCCQVVIPVGRDGVPMSISLLARKGADQLLLETVVLLYTTIQQEVLVIINPNLLISAFLDIR